MSNSERTLVMGILNVTPDSFADGGRHFDFDAAISDLRVKKLEFSASST